MFIFGMVLKGNHCFPLFVCFVQHLSTSLGGWVGYRERERQRRRERDRERDRERYRETRHRDKT